MHTNVGALLVVAAAVIVPARTAAAEEALVSVETPRGVSQKFLLVKPADPVAAVVLFAGGHGGLGLSGPGSMKWGESNFLVRTRREFAARGIMTAVVDAPSDRKKLAGKFRMGAGHAGDIGTVVRHLKGLADVPVWLVGTSMGTFSAAGGAIAAPGVDGLVLTSTVTRARPKWSIAASHPDGVASMALERIAVPVLVLSHKDDGCAITPASDAAKLAARLTAAPRVKTLLLDGGDEPRSGPCKALSRHGFIGIEGKAVDAIAAFIKAGGR